MHILDAVSVSTSDMKRTVAFYTSLGFDFSDADLDQPHVEPRRDPAGARLMIDDARLLEELTGTAPVPANHSVFALLCESPAEVDTRAAAGAAAGGRLIKSPWNAPWGQRYSTLADPDGHMIDLFAPL